MQSWFIATYVEGLSKGGAEVVAHPGLGFRLMTVLTLTTGTVVVMWLGELITDSGVGNGSSLIIFAGIVAAMPDAMTRFLSGGGGTGGTSGLVVLFMLILVVATVAAICYFENANRRVPVQYTKPQVGRKMYQGAQSYLPLKINSRAHPPIFASSILMFPAQISRNVRLALAERVLLAHFFIRRTGATTRFLRSATCSSRSSTRRHFHPVDVADNLKRVGGFVRGLLQEHGHTSSSCCRGSRLPRALPAAVSVSDYSRCCRY